MNYYNTTSERGQELAKKKAKAKTQEDIVTMLFLSQAKLTPSQCWSKYKIMTGKINTPLTSIRRAITNLTNKDVLIKTDEKMKGSYGSNEFFWKAR